MRDKKSNRCKHRTSGIFSYCSIPPEDKGIPFFYKKWISLAKSVAASSSYEKQQMAAIIVKGGSILSCGRNEKRPRASSMNSLSIHAEEDAICHSARYSGGIDGSKILVYRFLKKNGNLANSKPCLLCRAALLKSGVKTAVYVDDGRICSMSIRTGVERMLYVSSETVKHRNEGFPRDVIRYGSSEAHKTA